MVWENVRFCPHLGVVGKNGLLKGNSTRIGVYKCYACRKPFTVKVGTIFEKSHIPMHIWLQAMHLICSSKKGFSANQFCRVLGVDFKTGWFIGHRIREAMKDDGSSGPLGGPGKIVEADETYFGRKEGTGPDQYPWKFDNETGSDRERAGRTPPKIPLITLFERGGKTRSVQAANITARTPRGATSAKASTPNPPVTHQR